MTDRPLRVVQCGTGNIGLRALREVIRHPNLELVGVRVYDPAKDGVDAGVLCGDGPVGVIATTEPGAVRALAADCALHMPRSFDVDEVVGMLECGTNVVTTRGELFARGDRLDHDARQRTKQKWRILFLDTPKVKMQILAHGYKPNQACAFTSRRLRICK